MACVEVVGRLAVVEISDKLFLSYTATVPCNSLNTLFCKKTEAHGEATIK